MKTLYNICNTNISNSLHSLYEASVLDADKTLSSGDNILDIKYVYDILKDATALNEYRKNWGNALQYIEKEKKYKEVKPTEMKKPGLYIAFERAEGGFMNKRHMRMSNDEPTKYWYLTGYHDSVKIIAHDGSNKYDVIYIDALLDDRNYKVERISNEILEVEYRKLLKRKNNTTIPYYTGVFKISDSYADIKFLYK